MKNENEKITVMQCRKLLGKKEKLFTDEEVLKIRDGMYLSAEKIMSFIKKMERERNPVWIGMIHDFKNKSK